MLTSLKESAERILTGHTHTFTAILGTITIKNTDIRGECVKERKLFYGKSKLTLRFEITRAPK